MLNAQLGIFKGMPRHDLRVDLAMRAFIDRMRDLIVLGIPHNDVTLRMQERGVPYHVMARVLSGR